MILIGCFLLLAGTLLFIFSSVEPGQRLVSLGQAMGGLAFISLGTAEILPKHRIKLAALLRFLAFTLFALSAGVLIAALWQILG
jgi:hypothetical protein